MSCHCASGVGEMSDQFECDNRADARGSTTHPADGRDRFAIKKIGREYVCHSRESSVRERRNREEKRDQGESACEDGGDKKCDAESAEHDQSFPGSPPRPTTFNPIAGHPSAKKLPERIVKVC